MSNGSLSTFSAYESMSEAAKRLGIGCERIEGGLPEDGGEDRDASFAATESAMRAWCRRNERMVSEGRVEDAEVYVGLERMERIKGILPRFRKIDQVSRELFLFGEPGFDPALGRAQMVHLDGGPMTLEWFLVVYAPRYKAVICARDLDGFGSGLPTAGRRFEGLKSHNPTLVEVLRDELRDLALG